MTMPSVNIREWIDSRPMTRYQWGILFLCFCIVTLDGFDAAIMGCGFHGHLATHSISI